MKILFSPSETKISGGTNPAINKDSFLFPELFETRMEIVKQYNDFITSASKDELIKLFGTKKEDVLEQYSKDLSWHISSKTSGPTMLTCGATTL